MSEFDIQISDPAGTICTVGHDEAVGLLSWLDLESDLGDLSEGLAVLRTALREFLGDLGESGE